MIPKSIQPVGGPGRRPWPTPIRIPEQLPVQRPADPHELALAATRKAVAAVTADPHTTSQVQGAGDEYTVDIHYSLDVDAVRAFAKEFHGDVSVCRVEYQDDAVDVNAKALVDGVQVTAWTRVPVAEATAKGLAVPA